MQEHIEEGSAATGQFGAEAARSGPRNAGLLEVLERADFGSRVRDEMLVIGVSEGHEVRLGRQALGDLHCLLALLGSDPKVERAWQWRGG
ncbi:hypothetical protein CTZ28_11575 [Streptomyces shenzhenensis]|uniref:Uncharacterized protein n=1 Tax=Streptomyces shenzhenensis TaxID=943815 RepID=A0A3M0I9H4_9ACTN|nr:hypothetical protein CTZ28_11575 [Streptomyces shenzhenensis]